MGTSIKGTQADLHTIMGGLRAAAGRGVPIIAMSYYVPELAGGWTASPARRSRC